MTVTGDGDLQGRGTLVRSFNIFVRIFIVIVVKLIVNFIAKRHRCHYHCRCRYWFSHLLRNTYISKFQLQSNPSTTVLCPQGSRCAMADLGVLDQTEARRAENKFLVDPVHPLSQGLDDSPPPPYLNVLIRH